MNIAKRDNPILDDTFGAGDTETEQVQHAFVDALALANAAVFLDIDKNGGIYERYFQPQDKATVRNVFMNILGDPPGDNQYGTGAALLGKITITHDDKGVCAETIGLAAEMYGPESDTPTMLICPEGFRHGGIGKDTNQVDCTTIGTTFSWRVKTLGSIVLHEYLHFKDLVSPPLSGKAEDQEGGYGAYYTREVLDRDIALLNADSYSFCTNEVLWSDYCHIQFEDPSVSDGEDPNCDNQPCQL